MKPIRETAAGRSIDAYVILNPSGQYVATVHSTGSQVDVWNGSGTPQQARAKGSGYNKLNANLSDMTIDGQRLYDSAECDEATEAILVAYHQGDLTIETASNQLALIGAYLSNYSLRSNRYESAHYQPGLSRLTALGYKVIQAI